MHKRFRKKLKHELKKLRRSLKGVHERFDVLVAVVPDTQKHVVVTKLVAERAAKAFHELGWEENLSDLLHQLGIKRHAWERTDEH